MARLVLSVLLGEGLAAFWLYSMFTSPTLLSGVLDGFLAIVAAGIALVATYDAGKRKR